MENLRVKYGDGLNLLKRCPGNLYNDLSNDRVGDKIVEHYFLPSGALFITDYNRKRKDASLKFWISGTSGEVSPYRSICW